MTTRQLRNIRNTTAQVLGQAHAITAPASDVFFQSHLMSLDHIERHHFSISETEKQAKAKVAFAKISGMKSIRVIRLKALIQDDFKGSQKDLSLRSKVSLSQLGQYLGGYRNLGEKTARKIEEACGKPAGWLDGNDGSDEAPSTKITTPTEIPADIQDVINLMLKTDERGRLKMKLAAVDAYELHNSHISRTQTIALDDAELLVIEKRRRANEMGKSLIDQAAESAFEDERHSKPSKRA